MPDGPVTLVVLGAGASYDVDIRNPPSRPIWRSPLTRDLIAFSSDRDKPHYQDILNKYVGAVSLLSGFSSEDPNFDFERELLRLKNHPDQATRINFKHVPPYLRDILAAVSHSYLNTRAVGAYSQLIRLLHAEYKQEIAVIVLNYDTLLETALSFHDPSAWKFLAIDDWVRIGRDLNIYKIHGSVDWMVPFGSKAQSWDNALRGFDPDKASRQDMIIKQNIDTIQSFGEGERWFYPLLTAPLAGKNTNDLVCPQFQTEILRNALPRVSKVLLAGTSAKDEDLLSLLKLLPQEIRLFHIVSTGRSDSLEIARRLKPVINALAGYIDLVDRPPSEKDDTVRAWSSLGFADYVRNGSAEKFAQFGVGN